MKKLLLFGDSLLNRYNKEICDKIESQTGFDVYNCAVGGWSTVDGVRKSKYVASLKPDAVLLSFGTNDAAPWKQVALRNYEANLITILQVFKNAQRYILLPPPINEEGEQYEVKRTNALQKQYAEAAREISYANKVKIIDSWKLFEPLHREGKVFQTDGVHFNDVGNKLIVEEVIRIINDEN